MSGSGKRQPGPTLQGSLHETGLKISKSFVTNTVGSSKKYAATVHQGSAPHEIRARGRMLKFRWERGNLLIKRRRGRARTFFFFEKVNHPGLKRPTRFLTTPLNQFGRAAGFKVTTVGRGRTFLP